MKKIFSIYLILTLACSAIQAQYYTQDHQQQSSKTSRKIFDDWKERIYFGGNLGLSGWPSAKYFYVEAAPLVGYRITDRFSAGTTLTYIYLRQTIGYSVNNAFNTFQYRSHIFGFSPFTRMFLIDWFFLHAEYNLFSADLIKERDFGPNYIYAERGFVAFPLLGGGFVYKIGRNGGLMLMALYNPVYNSIKDKFPIYGSPLVLRVGFFF